MKKVHSIEEYIEMNSHFEKELNLLRAIISKTELKETIKWNAPVYTLDRKNVLGLGAFKNHFSIWFFNGVFLKDEQKLLVNAQEKTKGLRQMRFDYSNTINTNAVFTYVKEAIENQRLGKEIRNQKTEKRVNISMVLESLFQTDSVFKACFNKLTPFKQSEYAAYINDAKRETTKQTRLDKIKPMIINGIGLHDKYKKC